MGKEVNEYPSMNLAQHLVAMHKRPVNFHPLAGPTSCRGHDTNEIGGWLPGSYYSAYEALETVFGLRRMGLPDEIEHLFE